MLEGTKSNHRLGKACIRRNTCRAVLLGVAMKTRALLGNPASTSTTIWFSDRPIRYQTIGTLKLTRGDPEILEALVRVCLLDRRKARV